MSTDRDEGDQKMDHDGEIRELFEQLKEQDEQVARPFRAYLETIARPAGAAPIERPRPPLAAARREQPPVHSRAARLDQPSAPPGSALARPRWRPAVALAALLLAALTLVIWRQVGTIRPRPEASIAEISRWRAPTDYLLRTPGDQLLRTTPRFSAPLSGQSFLRR